MGLIRSIIEWLRGWQEPKPEPTPVPQDSTESVKKKLFELHNEERKRKGLNPLKRDWRLDKAAQDHNDWMAEHGNLSHDEPGRDVGKRVSEQGYEWRVIGENIAKGQRDAESAMNSWMQSSGHRANILKSAYKEVGFGVTEDGNGTWWWTTDFGA